MNIFFPRLKNDKKPELRLNRLQLNMKAEVERKVEEGVYLFEQIECPICRISNKDLLGEKDRYGLFFSTNICHTCGLIYTSPRMTQESYIHFYNSEYRKLYGGIEKPDMTFFDRQRQKGERIYNYLIKNGLLDSADISVLEVGCGAGGIIDFFREKGAKVKGLDLGKEYVDYGKEAYDLDLQVGMLSDLITNEEPDLIIYSHILEHILDVRKEVALIKKYSKRDTLVYIEVPGIKEIHKNYEMNILKYFQNAHTFHFSLESLANLMGTNGFELICGDQFVRSVFKLTPNQIENKNDYQDVLKVLTRFEENRWYYGFTKLGMLKRLTKGGINLLDLTHTRGIARKLKSYLA